jgi:hypothetical protein
MQIIGVDLHARQQSVAMLNVETGEMSGGQRRDDEVNGPSRPGEREAERSRNRESNQPSKEAQRRRNTEVLRKSKN